MYRPDELPISLLELCIYVYIYIQICIQKPPNLGWRVGHLGVLTSPFPPPNEGWAMAGTERGYPEPFVLLEPPAQNPGCCGVVT